MSVGGLSNKPYLGSRILWAGSRMSAVLLLACALLAPGPLWGANDRLEYQRATAAFHQAAKSPRTEPAVWRGIAVRFQKIYANGPKTKRGAFALYSAALSYKEAWRSRQDWKDLSRTVSRFRRFAEAFPRNRLADDSLMHLAELLATGYNDALGARKAYRQVLKRYSGGDQTPAARKQMAALDAALKAARVAQRPIPWNHGEKARFFRPVKPRRAAFSSTRKTRAGMAPGAKPVRPPLHRPNKTVTLLPLAPARGPSASVTKRASAKVTRVPSAIVKRGIASPKTAPAQKERPAPTRRVKRVQFWSTLEVTRVIITTDPEVTFRSEHLKGTRTLPERLFFDLPGALPAKGLAPTYPLSDGVLKRIRVGRAAGNRTRVVLDFNQVRKYEIKDFRLPSERKIVIDLYPFRQKAIARKSLKITKAKDRRVAQKPVRPPETLSLKSSLGLKVRSIMLDPGHGGRDPGAMAYGLREKKVALAIAKRLKILFKKENPNIRVGMTRENDRYIPLHQRPALAKRFGADLFVSIHLNANPKESFHGIETYFLNLTRNASALSLAARENATTEKRISDLNNILVDLLRDTNIVESSQLAKRLQTSLVDSLKIHHSIRDLGVKQAPFLVLMGAEMPSVLVEAGFLTNRRENRRLKSKAYLDRIAKGIHAGLQSYIKQQNLHAYFPSPRRIAGSPKL